MDWLAKLPDLNCIENLWGVLVRHLYASGHELGTVTTLKICTSEERTMIDKGLCNRLIRSMTERRAVILERQGLKIDY